jgi:spore germination cell wall hydrolase CwlJ-like protein
LPQPKRYGSNDEGHFVIIDSWKMPLIAGVIASLLFAAGCTRSADSLGDGLKTSSVNTKTYAYTAKDRECLARAMFFESHRSSREGLVAVGTVVMNRLQSGKYSDTVCGVVGEKGQFAPGVLSRPMNSAALPDVQSAADAVLKGERHPRVQNAMFFHVAGRRFPYKNMHYVLVAGGNAFYEKRSQLPAPQPEAPAEIDTAVADAMPAALPAKIELASATVVSQRAAPKGDRVVAAAASPRQPPSIETVRRPALSAEVDTLPDVEPAVFSFDAGPEAADAIGAMLLNQDRPSLE